MILGPEIHEATRSIVGILESMSVPYALGGAVAMTFLRHVRATKDVDLLILLPALKSQAFADALNNAGFRMHDDADRPVPVEVAAMIRSMRETGLCRVWWKEVKVELFVPKVPLQDAVLRRRFQVQLGDLDLWVTTAEDLILLKMIFHRDKDLVDVKRLLVANLDSLDYPYMESWIPRTLPTSVGDELRQMIGQSRGSGGPATS